MIGSLFRIMNCITAFSCSRDDLCVCYCSGKGGGRTSERRRCRTRACHVGCQWISPGRMKHQQPGTTLVPWSSIPIACFKTLSSAYLTGKLQKRYAGRRWPGGARGFTLGCCHEFRAGERDRMGCTSQVRPCLQSRNNIRRAVTCRPSQTSKAQLKKSRARRKKKKNKNPPPKGGGICTGHPVIGQQSVACLDRGHAIRS